jgi:hypothetical protein
LEPPGGITGGLIGGLGGLVGGGTAGGGFIGGGDAGSAADAGVGVPTSPDDAGLDGGVFDGGVDAGGDAGDAGDAALPGDAGDAGGCFSDGAPRSDGGCTGNYCATSASALDQSVTQGACRASDTLRLVCQGQIARSTVQCAQDNALSLYVGSSVRSCLRHEAQLSAVASDCLDCYVQELLCTLSSCLATCVAGFEPDCSDCRRTNCGAQFTSCSGLPAP